ncbi:hypothetical protein HK097_007746 [Rhizophlyctis rosea]|uniref:Histidine kinase n=1 Tax=Rhizophlyctis rosea TaxID=64517 RepID=A0AAD5SJ39_9FUNG|nr:hypothetical protein HK097_007746 [Rhizophlyctis rosea]
MEHNFLPTLDDIHEPLIVINGNAENLYHKEEFLERFNDARNVIEIVLIEHRQGFSQQLSDDLSSKRKFTLSTTCVTASRDEIEANITAKPKMNGADVDTYIKSEYLDHVSHEIRTPLHGIMGMIESLQTTDLNTTQKDCLKYLKFSVDALHQIVTYSLDISKFECGMLELFRKPFSLYELAYTLVQTYQYAVEDKQVKMVLDYNVGDGMLNFIGDDFRIRQIIANCLSNAVKYTEAGTITTHIESEILHCGSHLVRVSIIHTGKGIPEPALVQLFDAFTQFDADARRKSKGTGLGLYLCKKLSKLMEGDVSVESNVGQGSTFWFTVKLAPYGGEELLEGTVRNDVTEMGKERARVLIVEDSIINQRVLARMIERLGLHHMVAADGREAVKISEDMTFGAVLMDCDIEIMDGFEATKIIRSSTTNLCAPVPIIAITASGGEAVKRRCLSCGMNDILFKPVSQVQLMQMLEKWLPIADKD